MQRKTAKSACVENRYRGKHEITDAMRKSQQMAIGDRDTARFTNEMGINQHNARCSQRSYFKRWDLRKRSVFDTSQLRIESEYKSDVSCDARSDKRKVTMLHKERDQSKTAEEVTPKCTALCD